MQKLNFPGRLSDVVQFWLNPKPYGQHSAEISGGLQHALLTGTGIGTGVGIGTGTFSHGAG